MSQATTIPAKRPQSAQHRVCPECGDDMSERHPSARFCRTTCRDAFHNRRKDRGVDLYDLKMEERFNRTHPEHGELRTYIDRLCHTWHLEDLNRQRQTDPDLAEARPSWVAPWKWISDNPWIKNRNRRFIDGTGRGRYKS